MQDRYSQSDEVLLRCTAGPYIGSKADIDIRLAHVRSPPESGRSSTLSMFTKLQKRTRNCFTDLNQTSNEIDAARLLLFAESAKKLWASLRVGTMVSFQSIDIT